MGLENNLNNLEENVKVLHQQTQDALPFKMDFREIPYSSESQFLPDGPQRPKISLNHIHINWKTKTSRE